VRTHAVLVKGLQLLKVALKNQKIKSIILKGKTKSAINKEPHWIWIMEILTKTYKKSSYFQVPLSALYIQV
jgi:hypothetical protein